MRQKCRSRKRVRAGQAVTRYSAQVALFVFGDRYKQWSHRRFFWISQREADRRVAAGTAEAVIGLAVDEAHPAGEWRTVGYQAKELLRAERPSPATLTLSTMMAVAGERVGLRATLEVEKYAVWGLIGDTRAIAVRPRMSDADLARAAGLLRIGVGSQAQMLEAMAR